MSDQNTQAGRHEVALSVQVKFRCQETLKSQIDASAKLNEVSISNEISRRLESSFIKDQQSILETAFMGGSANAAIIRGISALMTIGAHRGDWEINDLRRLTIRLAITKLLDELMPFPDLNKWNGAEGAEPTSADLAQADSLNGVVDLYVENVRAIRPCGK